MIIAQFDFEFWMDAMNTTVYINNQCPTKALNSKTLQEACTSINIYVYHLRVFGCKMYAHILDEKRNKLESKSIHRVFLRYCEGTKAYHLMCVETKRIIKSQNVVFLEGTKEVEGVHHNKPPSKPI
jgi:hypothetical protein